MTEPESKNDSLDVDALILQVMRESLSQTREDLRSSVEKVRQFNQKKNTLRKYLVELRAFRARVMSVARERGVHVCHGDDKDLALLAELFGRFAQSYNVGEMEFELSIPARVPRAEVNNVALLDNEIARWEEQLAAIGDDAQLANIDLQNALQKQQQTLQMMSNISKMLHDTAMAVIRKMGG